MSADVGGLVNFLKDWMSLQLQQGTAAQEPLFARHHVYPVGSLLCLCYINTKGDCFCLSFCLWNGWQFSLLRLCQHKGPALQALCLSSCLSSCLLSELQLGDASARQAANLWLFRQLCFSRCCRASCLFQYPKMHKLQTYLHDSKISL